MHKVYHSGNFENEFTLSEEESKHAVRVMRLQEGDEIIILDGKGKKARVVIKEAHPKKCLVKVLELDKKEKRSSKQLTIAIAPTKNISRMEWFVEKATEIGIDRIALLNCARSERKVVKTERLEKIMISAMKQSGQLFLPKLEAMIPFKEFVAQNTTGFIAHCEDSEKTKCLSELIKTKNNLTILIGPEGDFTPNEINFALDNKYQAISLGKSILRTETAGIFTCSLVNAL